MEIKKRRKYDRDFKRNAVLLCTESGRSVSEVAENLGVNKHFLYRWRREYHGINGQNAFPGNDIEALTEEHKRIRELEKRLKDMEMKRDETFA